LWLQTPSSLKWEDASLDWSESYFSTQFVRPFLADLMNTPKDKKKKENFEIHVLVFTLYNTNFVFFSIFLQNNEHLSKINKIIAFRGVLTIILSNSSDDLMETSLGEASKYRAH
jgi:hypothetical protein